MRTLRRFAFCSLVCLLGACASGAPTPVPEYSAPPPVVTKLHVTFEAGEGVSPIDLPCGETELADNGLDDDCDGRVDDQAEAAPYLALARTDESALELELRDHEGKAVGTFLTPGGEACQGSTHTEPFELSEGRYALVAKRPKGCKSRTRDALGISVGPSRQVFAVSGFDEAPRTLGFVVVRPVPVDD